MTVYHTSVREACNAVEEGDEGIVEMGPREAAARAGLTKTLRYRLDFERKAVKLTQLLARATRTAEAQKRTR
jgi:hypothetical protein